MARAGNANRGNDPLASAAAAVVAASPELSTRMEKLTESIIAEAEHTMRWGSTSDRQSLVKALVPVMIRGMQAGAGSAEDVARRDAYERMMASMRGEDPDG